MDGSGGSPSPLLHTHQSQDNSKVNHRASAWTHIGMGGLGAAFHPRAPPRLAHHPGAPLSWEGSRSGSGRWLRGQVTGLPPEQALRSARNLRVPVQVSVGTEIFREMTGRSAGAGGRRARPGLGWEAGERGGAHGGRSPGRRPWRPEGRRAERRPGTYRPAPAVCAHVAVHLEAGGVVRGEDGVHAVLLLPAKQDVQAVPRPRACGRDGREGGWAPARPPLSPGLADLSLRHAPGGSG